MKGEEEEENDSIRRYDGLRLVMILVVTIALAMGLLLTVGCNRVDRAFRQATMESHVSPADKAFPEMIGGDSESGKGYDDTKEPSTTVVKHVTAIRQGPRYHDRIHINPIGRLAVVFNDSNKYQLDAAQKIGLVPIRSLSEAYFTSRPVVKIESNKYYTVDSLKHSLPYLVPEASQLLTDIGSNFIDSLGKRGADGYRIRVTSLLRTPHTVKRLRRVNRNAVDSSTHQYGTTFDISFTRFDCLDSTRTIHEEDLKNLLGEVLLDLRKDNRCLVKYERKGGCFHITATGK